MKTKTSRVAIIVSLLVLFILSSCSSSSVPIGLIIEEGAYPSPDEKWVLKVSREEKVLIVYVIENESNSTITFRPDREFSDFSRWSFFWESNNILWCQSSDIGTSVWIQGSDEVWDQHWLASDSEYIEKIPDLLWGNLSGTEKRLWIEKRR